MKRSASIITVGTSTLVIAAALVFPALATAESRTTVNVNNSTGNNTICQNGKCTTTSGGTSESHVCVNGKCWDSNDGNVNYESEDGNTKVNINNNSDSSVTVQNNDSEDEETEETVVKKVLPKASPTMMQDVKGAHDQRVAALAEGKRKAALAQQEAEAKRFTLAKFFEAELASIRNFFASIFGK